MLTAYEGLSRLPGNLHGRFLGELGAATLPGLPDNGRLFGAKTGNFWQNFLQIWTWRKLHQYF
jgi:hypothetical protein